VHIDGSELLVDANIDESNLYENDIVVAIMIISRSSACCSEPRPYSTSNSGDIRRRFATKSNTTSLPCLYFIIEAIRDNQNHDHGSIHFNSIRYVVFWLYMYLNANLLRRRNVLREKYCQFRGPSLGTNVNSTDRT
jgi:hypothetical protein